MSAVCIDCGASVDPLGTQQHEGRERRAFLVSCVPDRCVPDRCVPDQASEGTQSRGNAIECHVCHRFPAIDSLTRVAASIGRQPSV